MIRIENFNNLESSGIAYGGHSGSKKGVIINNERWLLKYPKSTKSMDVKSLSYTTTPLSEYLGSHIYETIGIDTHETKLGIMNDKVVVACKDFLNDKEIILDYNAIKNEYDEEIEKVIDSLNLSKRTHNLDEVILVIENNIYFKKTEGLKERFWDMFVIDALIGNNDRNEGNWGLVIDKETKNIRIAPVFDNGASFNSKSDDNKLNNIYNDKLKFHQSVYESARSIFTKNDSYINPLKYIESMENIECNNAIKRIVPKINLLKIKQIFDDLPNMYNELIVLSNAQKRFYLETIVYRYQNVLLPTYNELVKSDSVDVLQSIIDKKV